MSRQEQVVSLFAKWDLDHSGVVEWDEMFAVLRGCEQTNIPSADMAAMRALKERMLEGGDGITRDAFVAHFESVFRGKSDEGWANLLIAVFEVIQSHESAWRTQIEEDRMLRSPTTRRTDSRMSHLRSVSFEGCRPSQEQMLFLFDKWDIDGSGLIEWDELTNVLAECTQSTKFTKRDKKLMAQMKVKMWEGGKARGLSEKQFTALMQCLFGEHDAEEWAAVFEQFCAAIDAMKEQLDPEGMKRLQWMLFRVLDADLDGEVDYKLLVELLGEVTPLTKHERKSVLRWEGFLKSQRIASAGPVRITMPVFLKFLDDFLAERSLDSALDKLEEVHDTLRARHHPSGLQGYMRDERVVQLVEDMTTHVLSQQAEDPLQAMIEYLEAARGAHA